MLKTDELESHREKRTWLPVYTTLAEILAVVGDPMDWRQFRDGACALDFTNLELVLDSSVEEGTARSAIEPDGPLCADTDSANEYNNVMTRRYRVAPAFFKVVRDHFAAIAAANQAHAEVEDAGRQETPERSVKGLRDAAMILNVGRDAIRRKIESLPRDRRPVKSGTAWWWASPSACRDWWAEVHKSHAQTPRKARTERSAKGAVPQWGDI